MSLSNRHIELQNMTGTWIENRSIKIACLPECNTPGYLADYVAVAQMKDEYHTKYTQHSGLEKKYSNWSLRNNCYENSGGIDRWYICVFEVKISRSDFLNTFGQRDTPHSNARKVPTGTAHWVVADKNICKPEEVPEYWGLLEPYGSGLTERKMPKLNVLTDSKLHAIAFDVFFMQMNYRNSYRLQFTEMAKTIRDVQRAILHGEEQAELLRLSNIAVDICKGYGSGY